MNRRPRKARVVEAPLAVASDGTRLVSNPSSRVGPPRRNFESRESRPPGQKLPPGQIRADHVSDALPRSRGGLWPVFGPRPSHTTARHKKRPVRHLSKPTIVKQAEIGCRFRRFGRRSPNPAGSCVGSNASGSRWPLPTRLGHERTLDHLGELLGALRLDDWPHRDEANRDVTTDEAAEPCEGALAIYWFGAARREGTFMTTAPHVAISLGRISASHQMCESRSASGVSSNRHSAGSSDST